MNTSKFADCTKNDLQTNLIGVPVLAASCIANYLRQLPEQSNIVFYGCGAIADNLVNEYKNELSLHKIIFATTSPGKTDTFKGYSLKTINDLGDNPPELIILLSKVFEKDMLDNLTFFPRKQVITLTEVITKATTPVIFQKALDLIQDRLIPEITTIRNLCLSGKPTVCFTTMHLSHNFLKIMQTLSQQGYIVVVILGNASLNNTIDIESFKNEGYFHHLYITKYSYAIELQTILQKCRFSLIHAVASMAETISLAYALPAASSPVIVEYLDFKQIVFDDDKLAQEQLGLTKEELEEEKAAQQAVYCCADGIIIKDSPEIIDYLAEKYDYRPKWISFMSYVSSKFIIPHTNAAKKKSTEDGRIHIVYAGCLHNNPRWHPTPIFKSTLTAIEQLTEQDIHFSIYNAMDNTGDGFEEYLELTENNKLFDYHFALPYHKLSAILASYDFGWFCFDFSNALETSFFHKTTFGSKVFSYLEAGLPILVSPEQAYMTKVVEDLGVGIPLPFSDITRLSNILDDLDMPVILKTITHVQQTMTMDQQLPRLLDFYTEMRNISSNINN